MKKVFDFINSLSSKEIELFGYPTIKPYSDSVDVVFSTSSTLRSLGFFNVPCDEYSLYANSDKLIIVFTFNR